MGSSVLNSIFILSETFMYTKTHVYVNKYPYSELLAPTIILRQHVFLYSENHQPPNTKLVRATSHDGLKLMPEQFWSFIMFLCSQLRRRRRHIGLVLSVRPPSICPSVCYTCTRSRTVRERILKLGLWDEYENLDDPYLIFLSIGFVTAELLPFSKFFILITL